MKTGAWFKTHKSLAKPGNRSDPKPSLSQWLALVAELERPDGNAIVSRLTPTTAGGKNWKHKDAKAVLDKLNNVEASRRKLYARLFVRWLRSAMRKEAR